jgi:hypothetical protein
LAATLLVVGLTATTANSATVTVDAGGSGDYTTIGAAITGASAGDTINVLAGNYNENFTIDKDGLILNAIGTVNLTTIAGGNKYTKPIDVKANNVTIDGLRIQSDTPDYGYQIHQGSAYSGLIVKNNTILNSRAGVLAYGDNLTVENNTIGNMQGKQIWLGGVNNATIRNNWLFREAYASGTEGVYFEYVNAPDVGDQIIVDHNYIYGMRVGVHIYLPSASTPGGNITIAHNTIDGEADAWGAGGNGTMGISMYSSGEVFTDAYIDLRDNLIHAARWYGLLDGGDAGTLLTDITVENTLFYDNFRENAYYPTYALDNEWPGARGQAGWSDATGSFLFPGSFVGDPMFAKIGSNPSTYYALLLGSPALNAASDGTHIGAYQGAGVAVPLPAAAWAGLMLIGGLGGVRGLRRKRHMA